MTAIHMQKRISISSKLKQLFYKKGDELPSQNKTDSEFILIWTMWAKYKQSEIQTVKRIRTRASSNNCLQ